MVQFYLKQLYQFSETIIVLTEVDYNLQKHLTYVFKFLPCYLEKSPANFVLLLRKSFSFFLLML